VSPGELVGLAEIIILGEFFGGRHLLADVVVICFEGVFG
jgi:hypothetical protein